MPLAGLAQGCRLLLRLHRGQRRLGEGRRCAADQDCVILFHSRR